MSNQKNFSNLSRFFAGIVIVLALAIGTFIFLFILGAEDNFDAEGHPKNILGIMYKGGFIVPILIGVLVTVIAISIERLITISRAKGKGSIEAFVHKIKGMLASKNFFSYSLIMATVLSLESPSTIITSNLL